MNPNKEYNQEEYVPRPVGRNFMVVWPRLNAVHRST